MNYAVVEKDSHIVHAIIDESFKSFFEKSFPMFNIVKIENIVNSVLSFKDCRINTISCFPEGCNYNRDAFHLVNRIPDNITLKEVYQELK